MLENLHFIINSSMPVNNGNRLNTPIADNLMKRTASLLDLELIIAAHSMGMMIAFSCTWYPSMKEHREVYRTDRMSRSGVT